MADPFPTLFDSPEQSPGFLLWQVAHSWQRGQKAALDTVGLTHGQFVHLATLAWLTRTGAVVTQVELARFAHTDVMVTSKVLRALETRELVIRSAHPDDSRANCLTLTPAGRSLVTGRPCSRWLRLSERRGQRQESENSSRRNVR